MSLAGRVALVTGAAGGIGSAVVREFAAQGADVCLADVRVADHLAREVQALGRKARAVAMDVTHGAEVRAVVGETVAQLGRLDVLVNVAGTVSFGSAQSITEEEWDRVHAINLKGSFLACQAAIAPMRRQRYGRIVNIGSILAKNGGNARPWIDSTEQERAANVAYGTSKAGVHALTLYLAKELAKDGITVNAVAPGPIASAMTADFPQRLRDLIPAGRMGDAAEVAKACAFLAQESSGFITGEILDVNGGMWGD
jgi:3-oxoacyl-[acyl-carrier protein] reductase